ncbi:SRPBCC family protein [Gordonia sp. SID5947]|uniref:SRPBCC family protein n=1 Tax=Gordonia sp. SID5947 TaxID=2690315 RepID=UPI00136E7DDA|nr:SRPBCC family protein [Gordonia sp. SID5947]MYR05556.1 SRPBCC family protein [Gordonia sp. SID5947]
MSWTHRVRIADVTVPFAASPEVAFAYLVDPGTRHEWQSSLRRVADLAPVGQRPGDTGTSWTDITLVPWVHPRLEVVECAPPRRWREIGRWWLVDASLSLAVESGSDGRTHVRAQAFLTVPALLAPPVVALKTLAPFALRADMRAAAAAVDGEGRRVVTSDQPRG